MIPLPLHVGWTYFFTKKRLRKERNNSLFIPGKHYFHQLMGLTSRMDARTPDLMLLRILHLCDILPQGPSSSLIMRKHQTSLSRLEDVLQNT